MAGYFGRGRPITGINTYTKTQSDDRFVEFVDITGIILWYCADSPPTGWLECDGSAISRTTYAALFSAIGTTFGVGDGSTTFDLPDLRGEFIRGWDNGRGVDSSRTFGSFQDEEFESHTHGPESGSTHITSRKAGSFALNSTAGGSHLVTYVTGNTGPSGGDETRPRNIALLPIIKY